MRVINAIWHLHRIIYIYCKNRIISKFVKFVIFNDKYKDGDKYKKL